MNVISTAALAVVPSLFPVAAVDPATLNFAAMFDVEMAVGGPVVPKVIKGAAGGGPAVPPTAVAMTPDVYPMEDLENAMVADALDATNVASGDDECADIHSADLVLGLSVAMVPPVTQLAPMESVPTAESVEDDDLPIKPVPQRMPLQAAKAMLVVGKTLTPELAEPLATGDTSKLVDPLALPLIEVQQQPAPVLDRAYPAFDSGRLSPAADMPNNAPVERLLAALSHDGPAERQWLDTVIRDVASVAVKSGDVRFRVEPEGYGRMTIERTADRLEISVAEPRAMVVAEAARPQVVAGAAVLGVPVTGAAVVLDQPGQQGREEARQRQQIEHWDADEADEDHSADIGRYA